MRHGLRNRLRRGDERGAILVISVVGVVLAVISTALAVDLGRLAQDKRKDQKAADLAALDASRDLTQACARAKASVVRNGFAASTLNCADPATNPAADVVLGKMVNGAFSADPAGDAVQVKVHSAFKTVFPFVVGPNGLDVKAAASATPWAGFGIGSGLVTIDSSKVALLNPLVGRMIGGSDLTMSLVSWQGLANGSVTLQALQNQLASAGFSVGTVSQLLSTQMTLAQFYQATASALTAGGDTANANLFNVLKAAATSTVKMSIGDFLTVAQGAEGVALGSQFNLFSLATAAAEASAANGTNFIDVSNVAISVPGVASTSLHLKVGEGMQFYVGPKGGSVSTGQVDFTVTPNLDLNVAVGLSLVRVKNNLPLNITAAGATGTLKDVLCGASPGITVTADPKAFSGPNASTTLSVTTLGLLPLLDLQTTTATPSIDGPPVDVSFSYPSEFSPPAGTKHVGSQPVGLQTLTSVSGTAVNANVANILTLGLGTTSSSIVNAVLNSLHTVIGNVDNNVLTPLLSSLGLDVGSADVLATAGAFSPTTCGQPRLVS